MPQAAKTAPKANGGDKQERKIVIPAEYVHAAKVLEYERARIVAAINANRTFLRMLDTAGALDDLEGEWLDVFYATKKKNVIGPTRRLPPPRHSERLHVRKSQ